MADDKDKNGDVPVSDAEILADLERESKEFDKDSEIDRIMHSNYFNAYEVLDLLPGVPEKDIKVCYRKKSLLIHPDKTQNTQAPDAFDRLKKAQDDLLDEKKRGELDEVISDARRLVMRDHKWTVDSEELTSEWYYKDLLPQKIRHVLVEEQLRKQRQQKAQSREEGRQQKKDEEEISERKRKREADQKWEDSRDTRINSWRNFKKGVNGGGGGGGENGIKKKKKMKVLG